MAEPQLLPSDPAPDDSPRRRPSSPPVTCAFCGCVIAADGGVLRTGDRAKSLVKLEDKIEGERARVESLERQLGEARARVAELEAAASDDDDDAADDDTW